MSSNNISIADLKEALQLKVTASHKVSVLRFFKTGANDYAAQDIFIGVKVPDIRMIAKESYVDTSIDTIVELLHSPIHEERALAIFILVLKFEKAEDLSTKKEIFDCYIMHRSKINNWDLVDSSAHKIVGPFLHLTNNVDYLHTLVKEDSIWSKRIAIVALWYLWKYDYVAFGLDLILQNLSHSHDLIQKANGWMLRELSKSGGEAHMLSFVKKHYDIIPRTTLRYAIERVNAPLKKLILTGDFNRWTDVEPMH